MKPIIGAKNTGYTIIGAVQFPHPADSHLYTVLGKLGDGNSAAYVVWAYNTQDGGYFWGNYFGTPSNNNYADAVRCFLEKVEDRARPFMRPVEVTT